MSDLSEHAQLLRTQLLDTEGRVSAAVKTMQNLQRNGHIDESVSVALQTAAEGLYWLGQFEDQDSEGQLVVLRDLFPPNLIQSYVECSMELEMVLELMATEAETSTTYDLVEEVLTRVAAILRAAADLRRDFREAVDRRYVATKSTLTSFTLWRRSQQATTKAEDAADSASESAGVTAEHSLSEEFVALATKEALAADWFRGLTIALFVLVITFAAYIAFGEAEKPALEVAQKFAIGVPVLLLAAYFGRESNQHRKTARWAQVLVAQLRSIRAYTVELPSSERDELKAIFGRRVFLESPDTAADGEVPPVIGDVSTILREAADLARAARGAS